MRVIQRKDAVPWGTAQVVDFVDAGFCRSQTCLCSEELGMSHGREFKYLLDAMDCSGARHNLNDDLVAAEMAAARKHIGFRARIVARLCLGLAAVGSMRRRRPESLDDAHARLASVSPNLLDDIAMKADLPAPYSGHVPAGRGLVRCPQVSDEAEVSKSAADAAKPFAEVGRSVRQPVIGLAPAE